MKHFLLLFYRITRKLRNQIINLTANFYCRIIFWVYSIQVEEGFHTNGFPQYYFKKNANIKIGKNFKINNGKYFNPIGRNQKCLFHVSKNASLEIGNNVGLSGTTIISQKSVVIGNNVKIGGNTVIYDTDFHSLELNERILLKENENKIIKRKVIIGDGVFIGAHSTILKGVSIGENSIIGACSVVSKNIPPNQIWAGNPAKFIRTIYDA